MTVDDGEGDMNLRYIASGGEKMSDSILDKWSSHPLIRLANFYGPSEVTIGCCSRNMDPDTPKANIGTAFANVSAYVRINIDSLAFRPLTHSRLLIPTLTSFLAVLWENYLWKDPWLVGATIDGMT